MAGQWSRLSLSKSRDSGGAGSSSSTTAVVRKGHFAVYTREGQRFVVPIAYLKSDMFMELFRMSEEEFGPPAGDRPITFPCDAEFMEHVVASLGGGDASSLKRRKKPHAQLRFL